MKTEPTRIAALYPQTGIPQIASKDFDLSSVNYFSSLLERYKYGKDTSKADHSFSLQF